MPIRCTCQARGGVYTITHKNASNVELLKLTYNRDWTGRIATQTEVRKNDDATTSTTNTWTYSYDPYNRLLTAACAGTNQVTYTYTYDNAGNRASKTIDEGTPTNYTYNSLNQLVSDGTKTYEYDVYGNLKKEKQGGTTKVEYFWSAEHRLTQAVLDTGKTLYFNYDDQGSRVEKKTQTGSSNPSLTRYLTDHQNPTGYSQTLSEFDPANPAGATDYVYADAPGPLAQVSSVPSVPSVVEYFHGDHLGSTRLLTDSAGSSISGSSFDFEPYGDPRSGSGSLTPYRFTGQFRDSDLGLQYHRARFLNTATANWLSSDRLFNFPGNFGNAYGYCGGNPPNGCDPTGTFSLTEIGVVSSIVGTLSGFITFGVTGNWRTAVTVGVLAALLTAAIMILITYLPDIISWFSKVMEYQTAHRTVSNSLYKKLLEAFGEGGGTVAQRNAFFSGVSNWRLYFTELPIGVGQQLLKVFTNPMAFLKWLNPTPAALVGLIVIAVGVVVTLVILYRDDLESLAQELNLIRSRNE